MASELIPVPDNLAFDATIRGLDSTQQVFGRYTLRRVLGRGGMGVVWLGYDEQLEREVALKFLPEEVFFDPGALDEMKRETRRCLDLTHPNIIRIYDFVKDHQAAAISMEYVDGQTLAALRVEKEQRVFEVDEIRNWVAHVCQGLHYAHEEAGVVHRDLKPANLMLTSRGQIKIADFGIAQSMGESMSRLTLRRGTSGTLAYMSPQQLTGDIPRVTDDIYALGTTLYELLTSKPPFYSGDIPFQVRVTLPRTMAERRRELAISGQEIPEEWEEAIAACLAKVPAERPTSMMDVAERLGLSHGSPLARTSSHSATASVATGTKAARTAQPPPLPRGPFPVKQTLMAAGAVTAVALVLGFLLLLPKPRPPVRPGELRLSSNPIGAIVHIPGQSDRATPATFAGLPVGPYHVTLSVDGFDSQAQEIAITPGAKLDLGTIQLQRSFGSLNLATVPLHAHYVLEGVGAMASFKKEGTTPDFLLNLPSGPYRLALTAAGLPSSTANIQISPHRTKSEAADLTQLAIASTASAGPAKVIRGEMPAADLDSSAKNELAGLYRKAFEEYLGSGLLAPAAAELTKLKALGENTDVLQGELSARCATAECDFAAKIGSLIAAGKCATAEEEFKNINGQIEPASVDRVRAQYQVPLTAYRQKMTAALQTTRSVPPATAYPQLRILVRQYPDDLDLLLALAEIQTQMPPDHEFLASQLAAFQHFGEENHDFAAEPALVETQAVFADESRQLDALTQALSQAKDGTHEIRRKIANLESRKEVLENRRVGHPKGNPFSDTVNFFGKAVTGHRVVDNEAYFSSLREKREAIDEVQSEIDADKLTLAQPQVTIDEAQKNYNDFIARVPWGTASSNSPSASATPGVATAAANP